MPERDGYIPGVPCWVDTGQPDPKAAVNFYRGLFGWEFEDVMPPGTGAHYFVGRIRGGDVAAVSSLPEGTPPTATWNTYVWTDGADDTAAKVRAAGGTVLSEPFDVMDAGRMVVFADREGAVCCGWQANKHKGAQVVNENGALNFNGLHTRDVAAAKAFYGSVFGWGTLDANMREDTMWTMPGYGDHLEAATPGLREMIAGMGGPTGFEDVVAAIDPIPDDQPDTAPHWSVTFGVDDVDAIAARASELGGAVIMPPTDAPWSRTAVLADPAGATFIAGQFVPENKEIAA